MERGGARRASVIIGHAERQVAIRGISRPRAVEADSRLVITPERRVLPAIQEPVAVGVQRRTIRLRGVVCWTRRRKRERRSERLADGPTWDVDRLQRSNALVLAPKDVPVLGTESHGVGGQAPRKRGWAKKR